MTRKDEATERTCIVTREALPADALVRFVLSPEGEVVPDLRRRLPGRGVWVTASADKVAVAERKHLFARGFGEPARVAPGLADRVGELLRQGAVAALSLARKAGTAVSGFAKVEAALEKGGVVALIHAAGTDGDSAGKLDRAARRRKPDMPVIGLYAGQELDLAFGRPNVVHAALLVGPASDNVLARLRYLARYLGRDGGAGALSTEPDTEPNEASAEP
jgi:predicted RNA-binding protein YlxR (DUF448 family)